MSQHLPTYVLIACVIIALAWEALAPRRPEQAGLGIRWLHNFGLTYLGQMTARGLGMLTPLAAAWVGQHYGFGLFQQVELGFVPVFLATMLVYELAGYVSHYLFHNVPLLWRLHAVHHNDVELDISTTYRHHPLELVITYCLVLPLILLLSPPVEVLLLYQSIQITIHVFAHSNIYLPQRVNRVLNYFIVTPDFHRLHHCSDKRFTNSNYGTVIPWLDHLFGTASSRPFEEQKTMQLGLEYARDARDSRLDQMLLLPFRSKVGFYSSPDVEEPG